MRIFLFFFFFFFFSIVIVSLFKGLSIYILMIYRMRNMQEYADNLLFLILSWNSFRFETYVSLKSRIMDHRQ